MSNLILIGYPRSGKTVMGQQIARHYGLPFIDTDALIASDCRHHYQIIGATAFRNLESLSLQSLKDRRKAVIATGGGVVLCPKNRELLKTLGTVVFINHPKAKIIHALIQPPRMAILQGDLATAAQELYANRQALYLETAHIVINDWVEIWEAIHLVPFFELRHGENLMGLPLALSSMAAQQDWH